MDAFHTVLSNVMDKHSVFYKKVNTPELSLILEFSWNPQIPAHQLYISSFFLVSRSGTFEIHLVVVALLPKLRIDLDIGHSSWICATVLDLPTRSPVLRRPRVLRRLSLPPS